MDIRAINKERLKVINSEYNQYTGLGSTSIERVCVNIKDCPTPDMYIPKDMYKTDFVQILVDKGVHGFIENHLHKQDTDEMYFNVWSAFMMERVRYDFEFWAISCVTIKEKGTGADIPFRLNRAQRYYLKYLEDLRLANKPIDIVLCKARQWGGSTLTQIYMLWIQLLHKKSWNSVICGHVENAARNVAGMLQKTIDNMPVWCCDVAVKTSPYQGSQKTRFIDYSNSRYSIGSAVKPEGLRSEDISMAHLTEVGLWQSTKGSKPEDLVQSIFGSILSDAYTVKVLESTAKGVGNYFHRTWVDAVAGKNNFTPVFVPWYMIDIYSEKLDVKIDEFISSLTEQEIELFELGATLQAINWYRNKQREINDPWRMCSEFPSTASEAFQSTGSRIFPMRYVENLRRTCLEPCYYGEFIAKSNKGADAFSDLRFEELPQTPDKENILWVWSLPDNTVDYIDRYVVTVDVGGVSSSADYSDISVADRMPMLEKNGIPEIVAEWHGHIEHDLLIWKAAQIAKAYGNALLVVESNTLETEGTEGDNFEYILDEIGDSYSNIYARTTSEQIRQGMPTKYGFHTNTRTKPMVINHLKACARDGLYLERCLQTTFELDTFELKEDGKKTGAVDGCHDDRVMARAILIYVCYEQPMPYLRQKSISKRRPIVSEASM